MGKMRFNHVVSRNTLFERHRRIERYQLSMIDNGDAIAEAIGFVHVMSSNEHGEIAGVLKVVEHLPDGHTGDGIEAGGGLVEKEDAGIVNQAARDLKTPPHASGKGLGLCFAPLEQVYGHQQVVDIALALCFGNLV